MIVSASYKTDIPAFYSEWFMNRLRAGYCRMVNPYNRNQHSTVSLRRQDVDGFVFWTKNLGPFLDILDEVHDGGFPFIVQYTINGYPRALESRVIDHTRSVRHLHTVSKRFGPRVGIWRYDTIVLSTLTDPSFHRTNFGQLAAQLEGSVDEVVVSFMQLYNKTTANMDAAAKTHDFAWEDPSPATKRALLVDLAAMAAQHGMRLTICTQPELRVEGVGDARCVDADRLADVAGRRVNAERKGMRDGCGCYASKDIGAYDTCPHGCVYCYAVRNRKLALSRYEQHDPEGEYLYPTKPPVLPPKRQLHLFEG